MSKSRGFAPSPLPGQVIDLSNETVSLAQGQETLFPRAICKLSKMRALNTGLAGQGAEGPESEGKTGFLNRYLVLPTAGL